MLKTRACSSKSNPSNSISFSLLSPIASFNFPLPLIIVGFVTVVRVSRGVLGNLSAECHSSLSTQIGDYCWVRHVTLEVATLITENGVFNKLP